LIVGLGINVGQRPGALPEGATSLAALWATEDRTLTTSVLDRTALAIDLLRALETRYATLRAGADLVAPWSRRLATLGREVVAHPAPGDPTTAAQPARPIHGRAVGVTASGALRVATATGEVVVTAGDVTLRAES
jgi:BirA family biotin operon repressor/biotin-[acetyl-CoA-carboxylase] ligase